MRNKKQKAETLEYSSRRNLHAAPSIPSKKITNTGFPSCRGTAGLAQQHVMHGGNESLCLEALSLEPLVLVTDFLGALQCPLSEGTCHWQQVSVHFDTCHFLNTHFGAGSMTDTILPLLN